MCLVFVAWRAHPRYRLVVAANRDEFHARPTAPASPWQAAWTRADDEPFPARMAEHRRTRSHAGADGGGGRDAASGGDGRRILAGRDLVAGGTWLGVTAGGRFAALTNFSGSSPPAPDAPSRGRLVVDYLRGARPAHAHAREVARDADRYSGFNLLLADRDALVCVTNRGSEPISEVPAGCHGLGNDRLDAPWPKVTAGLAEFRRVLAGSFDAQDLFTLLAVDDGPVAVEGLESASIVERARTARFIRNRIYGTRSSTVACFDRAGAAAFEERSFDARAVETGRVAFATPAPGDGGFSAVPIRSETRAAVAD